MSESQDWTLRWEDGEQARVLRCEGTQAMVLSTIAYPPGKPAKATIVASGLPMTLKVSRSRKVDGGFEISGRLVGATTAVLSALSTKATPA